MKKLLLAIGFAGVMASAAFAQTSMPMDHSGMHDAHDMSGMDHSQMGGSMVVSDPADGATLAQAPRTLGLNFVHPVMLQTVSIVGPGEAPIAATFRRPAAMTMQYDVALPALASGGYSVNWTATAAGHAMEGTLRFNVE